MRILFSGAASWCNGSYGKPLRYVVPLLHEMGHQCAIACFYGFLGGVVDTEVNGAPVRLYPMVRNKYLNDIIDYHQKDWEADVVVSFQDVWVLEKWGYPRKFVWLPWMPVDTHPVPPKVLEAIEGCYLPMSYSAWGREELVKCGWPTAKHVPLGVDLDVYQPGDQAQAREKLGLPQDVFIAGMVAANAAMPCRKSFPEVLQAWRKWLDAGNKGVLYLHTTITPSRDYGLDFVMCLNQLKLEWATLDDPEPEHRAQAQVLFPCQYRYWCQTITDAELATTYQAMNVLLSPSQAEGFGMPIVEAQACGVPVITLNETGMQDITFGGMCIDAAQPVWESLGGWRSVAPVAGIVGALDWARDMAAGPKARRYLAERARAGASDYSWRKVVTDYLLPILAELA